MGQRTDVKREDLYEGDEESNVIDILMQMQKQMIFLERKVDHLTKLLENKSSRESSYSKFPGKKRSFSGPKDRKFSRGFSKDDDTQSSGKYKDKEESFSKYGGDKKKDFFAKKIAGKSKGKKEKRGR